LRFEPEIETEDVVAKATADTDVVPVVVGAEMSVVPKD
jgi:hypothetical protein